MNNSYLSKVPIENVSNMLIMHYQIKNLVFKAIRSKFTSNDLSSIHPIV